jgi:hypothetical protein
VVTDAIAWMLYIAALEAQRKHKYRNLKNDTRWKRGIAELREGLAAVGQVL